MKLIRKLGEQLREYTARPVVVAFHRLLSVYDFSKVFFRSTARSLYRLVDHHRPPSLRIVSPCPRRWLTITDNDAGYILFASSPSDNDVLPGEREIERGGGRRTRCKRMELTRAQETDGKTEDTAYIRDI